MACTKVVRGKEGGCTWVSRGEGGMRMAGWLDGEGVCCFGLKFSTQGKNFLFCLWRRTWVDGLSWVLYWVCLGPHTPSSFRGCLTSIRKCFSPPDEISQSLNV